MSRHDRYMMMALEIAKREKEPGIDHRFGAILVRGSRIVSMGRNRRKTHTEAKDYFTQDLHAEVDALNRAESPEGCTLYVARYRVVGPGPSKPCSLCEKKIREKGIRQVYYLNSDQELERLF